MKADQNKRSGQPGTVVDYTGLDGCQRLIVLDGGKKMLPVDAEEAMAQLHYGDRVAVDYTEIEDAISICMVEDMSARVNTIFKMESYNLSWIDQKITKKYQKLYRCSDDEGAFIYIQTGIRSTLYDLEGKEVCATMGKAMSDCVRRFNGSTKCLIKEVL